MCSHPDRAPHGPQVVVVGFYHQHMGRVPFPVQGPWASHQEPVADVDAEVVAMVTCGGAHEMHGLDWEEDAYEAVRSRPWGTLVLPTGLGC